DGAEKKDRGERCDLEAGMAKLFARETCQTVTLEAMRILGANGYSADYPVERYYRDAPLMIIGEGTNEIQPLVSAKNLRKRVVAQVPGGARPPARPRPGATLRRTLRRHAARRAGR